MYEKCNSQLTLNLSTALVSCDISGTSYAFCHAKETISKQGTLAAKDLNWMDIPVTDMPPLPTSTAPSPNTEDTLADAVEPLPHESKTASQSTKTTWFIYGSLVLLGYLIKSYHFRLVNGSPHIFLAT